MLVGSTQELLHKEWNRFFAHGQQLEYLIKLREATEGSKAYR